MRNEGRPAPVEISPDDVAILQYTGIERNQEQYEAEITPESR